MRRIRDSPTASARLAARSTPLPRTAASVHDAPVSCGRRVRKNGVLTVMCGGKEDSYSAARRSRRLYARICKLLDRLSPAAHQDGQPDLHRSLVQGLSEGLPFAKKSGGTLRP